MNKKRLFFTVALAWAGLAACLGQSRERFLHFGPAADYVLINDKTIGDVPVEGLEAGLSIGFSNRGENSLWGVSLWGTFGFMNIYPSRDLNDGSDIITPLGTYSPVSLDSHFPNYNARVADRYAGRLEGEYLHRVNRPGARWWVLVGGQMSLHAYYNRILVFSNSESNYFFHLGLAPKVHAEYPFRMFRRDYRAVGSFSYDVLAVVARPAYSMPFPNGRMDNVRMAGPGGYGMAQTRVGLYHRMRKGNAWEAAYRWQYDFDSHMNRVRQAVHSLSFVLYINL